MVKFRFIFVIAYIFERKKSKLKIIVLAGYGFCISSVSYSYMGFASLSYMTVVHKFTCAGGFPLPFFQLPPPAHIKNPNNKTVP